MASSGKDSTIYSSDDDEVLRPVVKRKKRSKTIVSDSEEEDSDIEIKPRRALKPLRYESEDENNNSFNNDISSCSSESKNRTESLNDLSDNEQAEKCAICLSKFLGQDIATPETCDHVFCLECLQEWAKNVNTCPIDRLKFNLILIRHHKEDKIIKTIVVNNSALTYYSDSETESQSQTDYCDLCGEDKNEGAILRCHGCRKFYHYRCVLSEVPSSSDSWQCPACENYIWGRFDRMTPSAFRVYHSLNSGRRTHSPNNSPLRTHSSSREFVRLRRRFLYPRTIIRRFLSSSDSSDEDAERSSVPSRVYQSPLISSVSSKARCPLLGKRRNELYRSRNQALVSTATSAATESRSLYTGDSDDGDNDFGFSSTPVPENFDLVGSILQSQTLLHCPDILTLTRDGTLLPSPTNEGSSRRLSSNPVSTPQNPEESTPSSFHNSSLLNDNPISPFTNNIVVKQRPLNPTHNTSTKYGETPVQSYTCSSSGAPMERPLNYDESSVNRPLGANSNERFGNEPCSPVIQRNFCSASTPEDMKKDNRPVKGQHSEDEVDIYSDIESVGEEDGVTSDSVEPVKIDFKCDDSQLSNPNDSSDSSDNDLVIDEDQHMEEDNDKIKEHPEPVGHSTKNSTVNNNQVICESEDSNMSSNAGSDQLMIDTDAQNLNSSHMANSSDNCYNPDESSHGAFVNDESNNSKSNLENARKDESDSDAGAQESDVDMQGYEENSLDSTKKSNQGDASTPCTSVKSSPKSYRGETADGFEMQCDNSVSNENSRCDNNSPYEQEESKEVFEEVSNLENENTCDSISQEAEQQNFLNENNSNSSAASEVERNENFQNENNSNFSFASDQPNADTSEPEEFMDSNAPQECEGRTNNAELIDICNEISMKSDEDDNLDSLENASTPCLDENLDGQIENSPIRCENFEGDGQDFETASPNNSDKENDINESIIEKSEDETGANSTKGIDKDHQEGSVDLGIEDISDAGSEDIGEFADEVLPSEHVEKDFDDVERKVASLFSPEHVEDEEQLESSKQVSDEFKKCPSSHSNQSSEDQEEGEIIEERPVHRCRKKKGRYRDDTGEYGEFAPRVNISSLPRIPKLKRDRDKDSIPETIPFENKRTSVLSRVDLGGADISWKRLSKHTRERSYRDGRPKDEKLLYRERESRKKDKNSNDASRRNDSKNSDRRREDKKQELEKSKGDYDSRSRKIEKSKSGDRSYSEREKKKSRKDKHSRDKHSKEKKEKDRYDKKYSKDEDKYDREKLKEEIRFERELRYDKEERFERIVYEKGKFKDKEHKNKHKDRKSDSSKSCKEHSREKHKHTHSNDHFSDKQREVRKIDDKLKIVVEQKENRKDKSKHKERKEIKHDKKQILQRKVENERSPYTEPTSIESKEIFAKGDSIIINVNFNRASSPKVSTASDLGDANSKDRKALSEEQELEEQLVSVDKTKSAFDTSISKRPTTPPEKNTSVLSVSESYWQGGDDPDGNNTPSSEKSVEETCAENEAVGSANLYDTNSCSSPDIIEIQCVPKDNASVAEATSLTPDNETSNVSKENDSFGSKRRSPRSPSPPSPADNDSYDPCEPTRSPSPPPMPPAPPLPTMNPKPPPSPELPPLPPEPEPMEESQIPKQNTSEFVSVSSIMVSSAAQPVTVHTQTSTASPVSMQSMLLPPPSFLSHVSSTANSLPGISPLVSARNGNFQMSNHAGVILPSNHVQPIMSNFMPHMHGGSTLPPPPNPPNIPHMSSVPPPPPPPASMTLLSQARHPRLNVQPPLTPNSLLQSLTMVHGVNAAPVQLIHHLPPNLSGILANHQSPIVCTSQNQPTSLPVSITNQQVLRMVFSQNQVSNHSALLQNQNANNCNKSQGSSVNLMPSHTQTVPIASLQQKSDKHSKLSPSTEKNEVIDMEVDTPYSPGDSPSLDSIGDYSPTCSPVASSPKNKDVFDTLLPANQRTSDKRTYNAVATNEKPKQHSSSKKSKHEHKHHSVRMQVKDKCKKSKKEQKQAEKKETQLKLEDTQLKILDELPSSAVEMQVKEKFLKKLNRQERVVEEVKLALKPYYKSRDVTKEEYKDILRKSVPKICHNKSGEINPVKVKYLVECYVKKAKHSRKKGDKRKSKFS